MWIQLTDACKLYRLFFTTWYIYNFSQEKHTKGIPFQKKDCKSNQTVIFRHVATFPDRFQSKFQGRICYRLLLYTTNADVYSNRNNENVYCTSIQMREVQQYTLTERKTYININHETDTMKISTSTDKMKAYIVHQLKQQNYCGIYQQEQRNIHQHKP
jgi:hypothetical protein